MITLQCYNVKDWTISRQPYTFEKKDLYIDIFMYATNLKKYSYIVIFIESLYFVVDIKNKQVQDLQYLMSPTMAYFRNFGDQLVLLKSDYHRGHLVIPYNMYKFDSDTGNMIGFREQIFYYDGLGEFKNNMVCSNFTDKRKRLLSARCAISNSDLGEVVDIDLLDEDQF
jgi:hypothetical protein